jgi:hypothetical protein
MKKFTIIMISDFFILASSHSLGCKDYDVLSFSNLSFPIKKSL